MPENAVPDEVVIALSQEELLFLMNMLNIPALPGVKATMGDVPRELYLALMSAAERALRAAGLLQISHDLAVIESAVAGVLSFCARPDRGIIVNHSLTEAAGFSAIYHLSDSLRIKRHEVDGIHYFTLMPDTQAVLDDILAALRLGTVSPQDVAPTTFEVSGSELLLAALGRSAPQDSSAATIEALCSALNMDEDAAIQLVDIVHHDAVASASIGLWPAALGSDRGLGLIESQDAWWLLLPIEQAADQVRYEVQQVNGVTAQQRIITMLSATLGL